MRSQVAKALSAILRGILLKLTRNVVKSCGSLHFCLCGWWQMIDAQYMLLCHKEALI